MATGKDTQVLEDSSVLSDSVAEDQLGGSDTTSEDQAALDIADASSEDAARVDTSGNDVSPGDSVTSDVIQPDDLGQADSGFVDAVVTDDVVVGQDGVVSVDATNPDVIINPSCGEALQCFDNHGCSPPPLDAFVGTWVQKTVVNTPIFAQSGSPVCPPDATTVSLVIDNGTLIVDSGGGESRDYTYAMSGEVCATVGDKSYTIPIKLDVSGSLKVIDASAIEFGVQNGSAIQTTCVGTDQTGSPLLIRVLLKHVAPNSAGMPSDLYNNIVLKLMFDLQK